MPIHNASVVMMMLCYIFMADDKPSTGCGHCKIIKQSSVGPCSSNKTFLLLLFITYYYCTILFYGYSWHRTIVGNHTHGTTMRLDFRTIGRSRTTRYNNGIG